MNEITSWEGISYKKGDEVIIVATGAHGVIVDFVSAGAAYILQSKKTMPECRFTNEFRHINPGTGGGK